MMKIVTLTVDVLNCGSMVLMMEGRKCLCGAAVQNQS